MSATATVIGVYRVPANQPVHLVELEIKECVGMVDLLQLTQELPGQSRDNWQVPYGEKILDHDGTSIKADPFYGKDSPEDWIGAVRLAFFFHYLVTDRPLISPFGDLKLPEVEEKPDRLVFMEYEEVD